MLTGIRQSGFTFRSYTSPDEALRHLEAFLEEQGAGR
jgi:hypothetical protein